MLVQEVLLEGVAGHVEHPPAEEAGVALPAVVLHHPPHEIVHLGFQFDWIIDYIFEHLLRFYSVISIKLLKIQSGQPCRISKWFSIIQSTCAPGRAESSPGGCTCARGCCTYRGRCWRTPGTGNACRRASPCSRPADNQSVTLRNCRESSEYTIDQRSLIGYSWMYGS